MKHSLIGGIVVLLHLEFLSGTIRRNLELFPDLDLRLGNEQVSKRKLKKLRLFDDFADEGGLVEGVDKLKKHTSPLVQPSCEIGYDGAFPPFAKRPKLDLSLSLGLPAWCQDEITQTGSSSPRSPKRNPSGLNQPVYTISKDVNHMLGQPSQPDSLNVFSENRVMELKSCAPNTIKIKGEDSTTGDELCLYHTTNNVDSTSAQDRSSNDKQIVQGKEGTLPLREVDFQVNSKFWAWIS
ncbi:hypothetical protein PGTUg99_032329 [Puccinia graminis f. sp. tritici]|nr:hypothetical protein PGTUg99_032329 [Puccinia graminis f. sp. tritici]